MDSFLNLEPVCCSTSRSSCCFFTCIQISQEAGQVVWYSHLLKNFPVCCDPHSQRLSCSQWSRSRCFLEFSCFFYDPMNVVNLISGSSAFSKSSLNIWIFSVHILLKPSLKDFQYCLASMLNKCTCTVVDYSLALSFFGVRMKTDIFSYHLGYESIIFFTLSVLNWNWCQCNVGSFKILAVFPSLQFLETFKKSCVISSSVT